MPKVRYPNAYVRPFGSSVWSVDGMTHQQRSVTLRMPATIEPKLEQQIAEYAALVELGDKMGKHGFLDPSKFN